MSEQNLYRASGQWATRPADERYANLQEMHKACTNYRLLSEVQDYNSKSFAIQPRAKELTLTVSDDPEIKFTNWGFSQFCNSVGAPPNYIRKLSTDLAARNLNYGLEHMKRNDVQLMMYHPESLTNPYNRQLRCVTSQIYGRIWNNDVTERLMDLLAYGWRVPPARPAFPNQPGTRIATEDDVLNDAAFSLSVKVGDLIAPAGLYASDHDMFAFLVDPNRPIKEDGKGEPLYRGAFFWNSEVGSSYFGMQTFLYRHVCGNLICWGVENVRTVKIKHIGEADVVFNQEFNENANLIKGYLDSSVFKEETVISRAVNKYLGKDKEEVVEYLIDLPKLKIGSRIASDAYDTAEMYEDEDGSPNTLWGIVNGFTRLSQETAYTDERVEIDRVAGKLLSLAA